jgi:hypothetical protein
MIASEVWGHTGVLLFGLLVMGISAGLHNRSGIAGRNDVPTVIVHALSGFIGFLLALSMSLQLISHLYGWPHG